MLGVQGLQHSRTADVFRQWQGHRRSVELAHLLARETPASSVIYTLNHSGTLRYYAGRTTLRPDILSPEWFDRSVEWVRSRGLSAYLLLEDGEIEPFKARYAGQPVVATLDDRLTLIYAYASKNPYRLYDLTGPAHQTPRVFEVGDLHQLRSALPDPRAFDPQLEAGGR
jgi:hypothetical protein